MTYYLEKLKPRHPYIELAVSLRASCRMSSCCRWASVSFSFFKMSCTQTVSSQCVLHKNISSRMVSRASKLLLNNKRLNVKKKC